MQYLPLRADAWKLIAQAVESDSGKLMSEGTQMMSEGTQKWAEADQIAKQLSENQQKSCCEVWRSAILHCLQLNLSCMDCQATVNQWQMSIGWFIG